MFLLPLVLAGVLAFGLAGYLLLARGSRRPTSGWRQVLPAAALLRLLGLVGWSFLTLLTADSLW